MEEKSTKGLQWGLQGATRGNQEAAMGATTTWPGLPNTLIETLHVIFSSIVWALIKALSNRRMDSRTKLHTVWVTSSWETLRSFIEKKLQDDGF